MKKLAFAVCIILMSARPTFAAPQISAQHACLMEQGTGSIIYEYNGFDQYPMASTTKIMTAILALEKSDLDDEVAVSGNAVRQEGSSAYLRLGEIIKMEDLLYGLMLNSGNDAAVAVAEHISGNVACFAEEMNKKATEIGAFSTSFENPSGLDSERHFTTAADLAKITSYALNNDTFRKIVSTGTYKAKSVDGEVYFSNHNKLLRTYPGCIGVKTGYTKKVGRCLVSAADRDGVTLVCVTLGAPDDWRDHAALLDYGFKSVKPKTVLLEGEVLKEIATDSDTVIPVCSNESVSAAIPSGDDGKLEIILHTVPNIEADIDAGEKLGFCEVLFDGRVIAETNLVSGREYYRRKTVFEDMISFIKKLFSR